MWTSAKAPSLAEMETMAHEIFKRLPKGFRALCEGLIIRVDDFPTEEVLDEMDAASEFDLLGLFHGVPGARAFRRHLATEGVRPGAAARTFLDALALVRDADAEAPRTAAA